MQFTDRQRIAIEGYVKSSLVNFEKDSEWKERPKEQVVAAVAYLLDPAKSLLPANLDADFKAEVNELLAFNQHPLGLFQWLQRLEGLKEKEEVVLPEIKAVIKKVLLKALQELQQDHALLVCPRPVEKLSLEEVDADDNAAVSKQELIRISLDHDEEYPLPRVMIRFPKHSPFAIQTFIKLSQVFESLQLGSYKIFDQEYAQVDAIRGNYDNIIFYAIPSLTKEKFFKLLSAVRISNEETRHHIEHSVNFHFEHYYFPDLKTEEETLASVLKIMEERSQWRDWHTKYYHFARAIGILCRRDVGQWRNQDVEAAKKIIDKIDDKNNDEKLTLLRAELLNQIGLYYERQNDFDKAYQFYHDACMKLKYPERPQLMGWQRERPLTMGFEPSHSATQTKTARRLSSLIFIQDNYVKMAMRLGHDYHYVNMLISELETSITELLAIEPGKQLNVTYREKKAAWEVQNKGKEKALQVEPMPKLPKYGIFAKKIAEKFDFDLAKFVSVTGLDEAIIRHVKPALVSGVEIITDTLENAKKVEKIVRSKLMTVNGKEYGGHIYLDVGGESAVNVCFSAYEDLQRLMGVEVKKPSMLVSTREQTKIQSTFVLPKKERKYKKQLADGLELNFSKFISLTKLDESGILHIQNGLIKGIEIIAKSDEDAVTIENAILKLLARGNRSIYGGHISRRGDEVEVMFTAYDDLINLVNKGIHPLDDPQRFRRMFR